MDGLMYRNILVTGATGEVGWGVAHAALEAGAHAILPSRSAERVAELEAEFDHELAHPLHADVGTPEGRAAIRDAAQALGGLDHVVAPIGAWWQKGPSLDQPVEELEELLRTYVLVQFGLVRDLAPLLADASGSYTMVTGVAGQGQVDGAGLLVVAVRAQYALSEVLREEMRTGGVRFNELRIGTRIEREARPGVVPSREAGRDILRRVSAGARSEVLRYPSS